MAEPSRLSYGRYLKVDALLACQEPESARAGAPAHDEMLFIIVHQAYELWFKQILHELDRIQSDFAASPVADEHLGRIVAGLSRIHEILKLLVVQLDVLETMTPAGFLEFRDLLTPASGFQSVQFRLIETRLGLSDPRRIRIDDQSMRERLAPEDREKLDADNKPSLLGQLDAWLARTPFVALGDYNFRESYRAAVIAALKRDATSVGSDPSLPETQRQADAAAIEKALAQFQALFEPDAANSPWRMTAPAIEAALFIALYRDMPVLQLPFRLLQSLMDIDETLTLWRLRHALMVERMIGVRPGTGGSSGSGYLRATAERHRIFFDLFQLSTYLLAARDLPPLPENVRRRMGFSYGEA
ncbi:tryptophan 2,3-dioxygenase [Bosea caraganae]|uniref:Tryptophan 2,3-dioxygenase n=1 Tax=Bosea caraganae TaxID=2763117 RepID=A0A370L0I2_9HYPH|nr:tryptophan 2,3-dioxygenase family protein [Bosea caraganae]RDJ20707.1 tryptophan 2,3-dioxygenase [Bosea caraganae]RDJ28984.1 tryptophan 2,3-dioxygenase [Bosea caraganae]